LVFLTGQQEIEQACRRVVDLNDALNLDETVFQNSIKGLIAYPIYSSLETLEQKAIFEPPPRGMRKVVFATNIAQTSVTIPGIRYVIDCGFVKQKMYDPATSMDALVVVPISQATATQRAGRAGRTTTGKVYRLYSREAFDEMEPETLPEIQRSSLIGTVLQLKKMEIKDILSFEFIDPPDPELLLGAGRQLYMLGALDKEGNLTELGHMMSNFPISPFLSCALIASASNLGMPNELKFQESIPNGFGCSEEILTIVSMLSTEEIFITPRLAKKLDEAQKVRVKFSDKTGDHLTLLNVYEAWKQSDFSDDFCKRYWIHVRAMKVARSVRDQLVEIFNRHNLKRTSCLTRRVSHNRRQEINFTTSANLDPVPVLKSLARGFFIHTAKRHAGRIYFSHYLSSRIITPKSSTSSASHLLALAIHPNSCLGAISGHTGYGSSEDIASNAFKIVDIEALDFVVYHDVQFVNRAAMRCVSRIDFKWVEAWVDRVLEGVPHAEALVGGGMDVVMDERDSNIVLENSGHTIEVLEVDVETKKRAVMAENDEVKKRRVE
ncbi:DEAH-box ATP-dependent RNA helicase prp22, partial [Nowakowskiella sp. JEL0078]